MKPTDQQRAAVEARAPRVCVDAGAGSGKTRVLVERIVQLLENGETEIERVAAITFTDKAAAEMKARLRQAFRQRASAADRDTMSRWRGYERRLEGARIQTIHAFCAGVLREHALALGLDPDFGLQTEADSALTRRRVIRATLHGLFEQENEAAVRLATDFPMASLEEILGRLLQNPIKTDQAIALGPYDDPEALQAHWAEQAAAWREARFSFLEHSGKLRKFHAQLIAFDGVCVQPEDGREIWRKRMLEGLNFLIRGFRGKYRAKAMRYLAEKPPETASKKNWDPPEAFKALSDIQNKVRDFARDFEQADAPAPELEAEAAQYSCDLATVYRAIASAYGTAKSQGNTLDFEDLLLKTQHALQDDPAFAAEVAADIDHLLIDEFQDTDDIQLGIANALGNAPGGPQVFIVGDAKQSIYRFRGAEVGVFLGARDGAAEVLPLDTNFRTARDLLAFINDFFHGTGLLVSTIGKEESVHLQPHREPMDGPCADLLCPERPDQGKWNAPERRDAEADLIAAHIHQLCHGEQPAQVWDEELKAMRPAAYGDIAILFRAMSDVGIYQHALRAAGIPYTSTAGSGFYRLQEVFDIVNLCKVVLDPWDEPSLFAFLRSPLAALSDESLIRMTRDQPLVSAFQQDHVNDLPEDESELLERARELVLRLRASRSAPLADFLHRLVNETGIEAIVLGQHHGIQKVSNIRKLLHLASSFSGRRPPSLRGFVEYVDAIRDGRLTEGEAPLQPEGAGAVTMMTVHKSKGLEYPIVFVADMSREITTRNSSALRLHRKLGVTLHTRDEQSKAPPSSLVRAISDRETAEEEAESARLLYVALTRARDHLVLCGTPQAKSGSWWDTVNAHLGVDDAENGTLLGHSDWSIRVVRAAPKVTPAAARPANAVVDTEGIASRIAPIPDSTAPRESLSISALLDAMRGERDLDEHRETDDLSFSREAEAAMRRGTLVHRLFELWDMRPESPPPWDAVFAGSGLSLSEREMMQEDLREIAARFLAMPVAKVIQAAEQAEKELPFLLDVDGTWLRGTIDLLIPEGPIIDYKTGVFSAAKNEQYSWQLRLYAAAAHQLTGARPTHGVLAYVDAGREETVSFDDRDLDEAMARATTAISNLAAASA